MSYKADRLLQVCGDFRQCKRAFRVSKIFSGRKIPVPTSGRVRGNDAGTDPSHGHLEAEQDAVRFVRQPYQTGLEFFDRSGFPDSVIR